MYSCTKHLPSIQNPFGSESLLLVVILRQLYQYHKSAMLYPHSRTADNYPRQIRFYPHKPLGFDVILSTNHSISVFQLSARNTTPHRAKRKPCRQNPTPENHIIICLLDATKTQLSYTNLYYNNYTQIYVYIHNNIHNITVSLLPIHFSKSFTTISHSPPDVNPISNLAKNYISETYHHTRLYASTRIIFLKSCSSHLAPLAHFFYASYTRSQLGFCVRVYTHQTGGLICVPVCIFLKSQPTSCVCAQSWA